MNRIKATLDPSVHAAIEKLERAKKRGSTAPLHETVHQKAAAIKKIVAARGATNPRLFGSVARREDNETSDVDILVDAGPNLTLFGLAQIEIDLEELLGVDVDVVTAGSLHKAFREDVLSTAIPL